MERTKQECLKYFKSNKGYKRLFEKIREKYRMLGYLGGSIKLDNLTPEEQDALSGFLKGIFTVKKRDDKNRKLFKSIRKHKI
ncbi:hypothetical protein [Caloramator sp. Dgby_cultured_2]|uniref:hypothetical protein n=1 Tax=Caloramator sp. Dgby_cultured_2 TaxID=3029174 RepID=UPI00237D6F94|nr:hypothetical protein [Caloramator sp. Dgby_cultured_2]WDU82065.1 hypothetical protein PWK10_09715 [Caloramator sp. Dgby_cultured_2]